MPTRTLPRSVTSLLERFRGCFTAPTFEVSCALVVGFWAQLQAHTVTGMLVAAGLSATWHHSRAHRCFSAARWSADQLGLCLLDLILGLLIPAGAPVRLVVDDTLFRRSGRKIYGAAWHHDPLGVGRNAIAFQPRTAGHGHRPIRSRTEKARGSTPLTRPGGAEGRSCVVVGGALTAALVVAARGVPAPVVPQYPRRR
jgi:DDE superfamily endonuclease